MKGHTIAFQAVSASPDNLGDTLIKWVAEGNVSHDTFLEECKRSDTLGAVDDLVGNHEITGLDLLLQAANGGEGDDGADTDGTQGSNVGAGRDFVGRNLMVQAMATEEGNSDKLASVGALVVKNANRRGGVAPGSRDRQRSNLGEAWKLAKSSTTNDGDADGVWID